MPTAEDWPAQSEEDGIRIRHSLAARLRDIPAQDRLLRLRRRHLSLFWTWWERREARRLHALHPEPRRAQVAVVIPTFKRPALLREAVASVLAQTHRDFVAIVVDDGGGEVEGLPDDSRLHRVHLRRNTHVLGVVNNLGIRLTDSRYIALLNDDNRWKSDHLERAVAALEDGADLVYTGMRRHRSDGTDVDVLAVPFDRARMRCQFFTDSSTLVVRRAPGLHFDRTPRGKETAIKEDWEFVWRCSRTMATRLVDAVTVDYLIHDESYLTDWSRFWQQRDAGAAEL